MPRRLLAFLALATGCSYLPAKPTAQIDRQVVLAAPPAEVRAAAIEALTKLDLEVESATPEYVQAYRPKRSRFSGEGGQTVGLWMDAEGTGTRVLVDTGGVAAPAQRRWTAQVIAAVQRRLKERQAAASANAPAPDVEALIRPEPPARIRWGTSLLVDQGQTRLGWMNYIDGSTKYLNANDGVGLSLTVALPNLSLPSLPDGLLETQVSAGFKYKTLSASNGSIEWSAFPIEALECLNVGFFRAAAGPTLYLAPKVVSDGIATGNDLSFEPALGAIGQAGVQIPFERRRGGSASSMDVSFRYTWLRLKTSAASIDASAFGGVVTLLF